MKKIINFFKYYSLYVVAAACIVGSIFAVPFVCSAISSTVGAVFASAGLVVTGAMTGGLVATVQYAINGVGDLKKDIASGKVQPINESNMTQEDREELESWQAYQIKKQMKKSKKKKLVNVEENENTNDLSL